MAADYPNAIPTLETAGANLSTNPHSELHDRVREELLAALNELGLAPSGTFSTVKARLDDMTSKADRVGCTLQRAANQSIPNNTLTFINWDQEDADTSGFITVPGGTITIPAGLGGIYSIAAQAFCSTSWGGNINDQLLLSVGGIDWYFPTQNANNGSKTAGLVVPLAAGNTISFWVKHNMGSAQNFIARIYVYRVAV